MRRSHSSHPVRTVLLLQSQLPYAKHLLGLLASGTSRRASCVNGDYDARSRDSCHLFLNVLFTEELGNNPEEDIEETDVTQSDAEVAKPPKRRCKNRPAVKTTFPPNPTRKASSRARREQPATRNR